MNKVEHIGIAVKNLDESNDTYKKLLGKGHYKTETVESEHVMTSFFEVGDSKIELLQSTDENSAINKFIEKRGEGMHHIAFHVNDLQSEIERLIGEGFKPLMDQPKRGADNKMIFFFHPKSANGVLIELCADIKPGHESD